MRRIFMTSLAVLELIAAVALFQIGWLLPSKEKVHAGFSHAEKATKQASIQIYQIREKVQLLRQPKMQSAALKMKDQLQFITKNMREQKVDFESIAATRDAMGAVAKGLEGISDSFDPKGLEELGKGLTETADFLDQKLVPAAKEAADKLDRSIALMEKNSKSVAMLLAKNPADLKVVREVYESLEGYSKGMDLIDESLQLKRLKTMKEGFKGMDEALSRGANQVERLAGYTYPVVSFRGLRPEVRQQQFWREGEDIAKGMRQASKGVRAAGEQMDHMLKNLPKLKKSLQSTRKIVDASRETLGTALKKQEKVESILRNLPEQSAQLAKILPGFGKELSHVLRTTERFKKVAAALRNANQTLKQTSENWPETQKTLKTMAKVLKSGQKQLDQAIDREEEYNTAVHQSAELGETFATMLPLVSKQMDNQLEEDEKSMKELGASLEEMGNLLPEYRSNFIFLVQFGRWLVWLVSLIVIVHAGYLFFFSEIGNSRLANNN